MKYKMVKAVLAGSSVALLLALGACSRSDAPPPDAAPQAASQVRQQGGNPDSTVMGGPGALTQSAGNIAAAVAETVDDGKIVTHLKSEFAADKDISAMVVDIDSKGGMVTLSGVVPTSEAKVRADQMARAMKDVKSVNNQLEVRAG